MIAGVNEQRHIVEWLGRLKRAVPNPDKRPIDNATLDTFAELLARALPTAAFTGASLDIAVDGLQVWPIYRELKDLLTNWWRDHRPSSAPPLEYASEGSLDAMDRMWLDHWHKRIAEIGNLPDTPPGRDPAQHPRAKLASLVRAQSPAAWRIIAGQTYERGEPTEDEKERVAEILVGLVRVPEPEPPGRPKPRYLTEQEKALFAAAKSAQ
jgi:hypothetical protein